MEIAHLGMIHLSAHTKKVSVSCEWRMSNGDSHSSPIYRINCKRIGKGDQFGIFMEYRSAEENFVIDETDEAPLSPTEKILISAVMQKLGREMKKYKGNFESSSVQWIDITPCLSYDELKKSKYFAMKRRYFSRVFCKWFNLLYKRHQSHNIPVAKVSASRINFKILNNVDVNGLSYIHIASAHNCQEIMEIILKRNPNVDVNAQVPEDHPEFHGFTPLHFAAVNGHLNIVKYLISHHNVKFDIKYFNESVIEHLANYKKNRDAAKYLLSLYSDYEICPMNEKGLSYFHLACFYNLTSAVESFIKSGSVDVNSTIRDVDGWRGYTALHLAAGNENVAMVKLLLNAGANPNVMSACGATPLHRACRNSLTSV